MPTPHAAGGEIPDRPTVMSGGFCLSGNPENLIAALASIDETLRDFRFDLAAAWTNEFVKKANLRYPKG